MTTDAPIAPSTLEVASQTEAASVAIADAIIQASTGSITPAELREKLFSGILAGLSPKEIAEVIAKAREAFRPRLSEFFNRTRRKAKKGRNSLGRFLPWKRAESFGPERDEEAEKAFALFDAVMAEIEKDPRAQSPAEAFAVIPIVIPEEKIEKKPVVEEDTRPFHDDFGLSAKNFAVKARPDYQTNIPKACGCAIVNRRGGVFKRKGVKCSELHL